MSHVWRLYNDGRHCQKSIEVVIEEGIVGNGWGAADEVDGIGNIWAGDVACLKVGESYTDYSWGCSRNQKHDWALRLTKEIELETDQLPATV